MKIIAAVLTTMLSAAGAAAAERCNVPSSLAFSDADLTHVAATVKAHHRLEVSVIGSGSSTLPGQDGAQTAYPARLEDALKQRMPGVEIHVIAHVKSRQTSAEMAASLPLILATEKPALVIWQAGTVDAMRGVDPDEFRTTLEEGVGKLQTGGADVILMNMQYSPRTESMLGVSTYADIMHWVAQQRGAALFDRLALMRHWNEEGLFDLYAATKDYAMARQVHDCIGRALATQIIDASHLDSLKKQTTR
jgi:lysophospholipase L1-like esterase